MSSGTSGGDRKIFPRLEEDTERIWFGRCLVMPVVNKYLTGMDKGKAMVFMFSNEKAYTPGGLTYNSGLTLTYQCSPFKNSAYDPFDDETIHCLDFGQRSMSQHIPSVDYYSNEIPLVSARYICSECFLGINLNPFCKPTEVAYTFLPNMAYFEFLSIFNENQQKKNNNQQEEQNDTQVLVELTNVKLGHEYEIYITTYSGLYRYGVGDVVRVVGFKNTAPQFQFICRKKTLLSIDCEKRTELDLDNAVQNAIKHLMSKFEVSLVDYTSYADTTSASNHGHYVIYWELRHRNFTNINDGATLFSPTESVLEECCLKIEESLSSEYKENHTLDKSIDPMEIKIVELGTFGKLMDYAITQGSSFSQYKTPRCVKNVELLNSCVVSSYFSQEFPHYAQGL